MSTPAKPLNLGCAYGVAFSANGATLLVLGRDLVAWDVATRQKRWRGKFIAHCSNMALSPDGSRVAIKSTTGQMAVVDVTSGELLVNFQNKKDGEGCAPAWSPCGQYLADGGWNGRLQVREAATGKVVFMHEHAGEMLRGLQTLGAGQLLLQHGVKTVEEGQAQPPDYCTLWQWPLQAGGARRVLELPKLNSLMATPDGTLLATLHYGDGAQRLSIYSVADGLLLDTRVVPPGGGTGNTLRWLPDASAVVRIGKGQLECYGWPGLEERGALPFVYPCALDFLPGSDLAAIGSWEKGSLQALRFRTGKSA
ncbi:WD40 repeat domain-containing protein [Janthinobacterium aquaticum]|uniref:WD40 repeat domain-containing protein n=1 Tax=Janthinobacterium sp. FT58W TaxID=2654254 RepID=UPI001264ACC6|nr:PQQ-binding-like beta-propeller repeat protein [Janthinobacterium sp. FT58W]KAB8042462.1 PQQ-binding-like beta-propeller repeat protein [Janthinobacterium sp. FT58W]